MRETDHAAADFDSLPAGGMWVFAYGSLIWDPGFPVAERAVARLHGWHRSFCMRSIHHRGSAAQPGLVLALDRAQGAWCDGVAFRVAAGAEAEAETESESPESPESPTSGAPVPAGAQPAPRGAAPAADPERVHVLNNSTVPNLAADIAGTLDRDGYELGEVGNLAEVILPENTVFFQPGNQDAETRARELADRVGGVAREYDATLPDGTAGRNDLTLVLVEQVAL